MFSRCSLPVRQGWPKIAPRNTQLDTMGFEQLAVLKAQLAEQAKATKAPKRATPPRAREAAPANPAKPVDPVPVRSTPNNHNPSALPTYFRDSAMQYPALIGLASVGLHPFPP